MLCKSTNLPDCSCEYCVKLHTKQLLSIDFSLFVLHYCPRGKRDWHKCDCKMCLVAMEYIEKHNLRHGKDSIKVLCKRTKLDWIKCTCSECTYQNKDMVNELDRLSTFAKCPNTHMSFIKLAKAGYFFSNGNVTCFSCGLKWVSGRDPLHICITLKLE